MEVILASASKRRQNILDMTGLKYEVVTSELEEHSNENNPDEYVKELALNKALNVSKKINDKAIIIAADTIVYFNNKRYEKPKSKEEVIKNFIEFSNKVTYAYTGVAIIDLYKNKTISFSDVTELKFREINPEDAIWYANNEKEIFDCSGYVPLGKASLFIESINGDYNSLLGISPNSVFSKLKELGYSISDFEFIN